MAMRTRVALALALVSVAYFVACADAITYKVDDVFISLRVLHNVLRGNGPAFNVGERLEVISNPTWVWLLALPAKAFGISSLDALPWLARGVGCLLGWVGLVLFYATVGVPDQGSRSVRVLLTLALGVHPLFATYCVLGLENALVVVLLILALWLTRLYLAGRGESLLAAAAVCVGVLGISRPEGIIYVLAFLIACFYHWGRGVVGARSLMIAVFIAVGVPASMTIWRFSYYHAILPNTVYAKNYPSLATFYSGAKQLAIFTSIGVGAFLPLCLMGGTESSGSSRNRLKKVWDAYTLELLVLVFFVMFLIYVGGGQIGLFRLFTPLLVLFFLGIGAALGASRFGAPGAMRAVAVVAVAGAVSWFGSRAYMRQDGAFASGLRGWSGYGSLMENGAYREVAKELGALAKPGSLVVVAEAGVIPYFNPELRFTDVYGLMNKHIARDVKGAHFARLDPEYFANFEADFFITHECQLFKEIVGRPAFKAKYELAKRAGAMEIYARRPHSRDK